MRGTRLTAVVGTTLVASTLLCQADPIHEAAKRGDQSEVNRIVAAQPEALEARDARHGNTPLHWAAFHGHLDVVRTLIKNGANPNVHTKDGYTPLRDAAYRGHTEVVRFLLEAGARVEEPDKRGATPLHWVGHGGRAAVAKLLLEAGASPLNEDAFGATPVDWAVEAGHSHCARVMQRSIWPALAEAIRNDDQSRLKTLLERYPGLANLEIEIVDPDVVGEAGITPLSHAVWTNNLEQAEVLLRYGADPNLASINGNTTLHILADETGRFLSRRPITPERHLKLAKALVRAGVEVKARNSQGLTAQELAVKNGHAEVATYLRGVQ